MTDLADRLAALEDRVDRLEAENEELRETVAEQAETIASQRERLDDTRDRLDDLERGFDAAGDHRKHLQQRVHALEAGDGGSGESDATDSSPLKQLVRLPKAAVSKLTANQERARFVARDIREYASKVPAGFALDSGTIRKVLHAKEDRSPHTQTVTRVMDFLDRLGKEEVRVVKRRGTKRVVFSEHAVAELGSAASGSAPQGITDVVMGWR